MSVAVGDVHTRLAREAPRWARILEHLPGLNLTRNEMTSPVTYYPEFQQWTYYKGDGQVLGSIRTCLARKRWASRDEAFHLKKFSMYYGPYIRGIDPPVNLGKWENKYPLHSRFMHYFSPPVQSAVSIVRTRGVPSNSCDIHRILTNSATICYYSNTIREPSARIFSRCSLNRSMASSTSSGFSKTLPRIWVT